MNESNDYYLDVEDEDVDFEVEASKDEEDNLKYSIIKLEHLIRKK